MNTIIKEPKHINEIISQYLDLKLSMTKIAKIHNVGTWVIRKLLERNNIKRRQPKALKTLNDNYFQEINTEKKAYFLGLMIADGCVFRGENGKPRFSINLQERDKYILEIFAKDINFSGELSKINYSKINPKSQDAYVLQGRSIKLFEDLNKHGCVEKKTHNLKWIEENSIPEHLMNHFIRGFFDGDGWNNVEPPHGHHKSFNNCIGFIGTKHFITGLKNYLRDLLNIGDRKVMQKSGQIVYCIGIAGNLKTKKVYDYMYKNATVWLSRKRNKFIYNSTPLKRGPKAKKTHLTNNQANILNA